MVEMGICAMFRPYIPIVTHLDTDRFVAFDLSLMMRSRITACLALDLEFLLLFGCFLDGRADSVLRLLNVGKLKINQDCTVKLAVPKNVLGTQVALLDTLGRDFLICSPCL